MTTSNTDTYDILVIEDSPTIRTLITHIIKSEGYRIGSFNLAIDALNHLRRSSLPRLILLDLVLPSMTSEEFLHELELDQRLRDIPVIIISTYTYNDPQPIPHTVAYLEKPIDIDVLMSYVRTYCG